MLVVFDAFEIGIIDFVQRSNEFHKPAAAVVFVGFITHGRVKTGDVQIIGRRGGIERRMVAVEQIAGWRIERLRQVFQGVELRPQGTGGISGQGILPVVTSRADGNFAVAEVKNRVAPVGVHQVETRNGFHFQDVVKFAETAGLVHAVPFFQCPYVEHARTPDGKRTLLVAEGRPVHAPPGFFVDFNFNARHFYLQRNIALFECKPLIVKTVL